MTPRQFEAEFGRPVALAVSVPAGQRTIIPSDPDRYLIVFWATQSAISFVPSEDPEGQLTYTNFGTLDQPLSFDHAHFGSLPGMAFTVNNPGAKTTLTIVVGRMVASTYPDPLRGLYRARNDQPETVHNGTGVNARPRGKRASKGVDNLPVVKRAYPLLPRR